MSGNSHVLGTDLTPERIGMQKVIDMHRMYSPSSPKSAERKFHTGRTGVKNELCYPGQRRRCACVGECLGDDPDAIRICDKTTIVPGLPLPHIPKEEG